MSDNRWMLYGATGYTGTLLAEEAVRRGHRPLLAGRSPEKLRPLAERLDLELLAVAVEETTALEAALRDVALVFNAAGPFSRTSAPILDACLATKTSYVDITGEMPVLEHTLGLDAQARELGLLFISGLGFDVVPTDCLAKYVADAVPGVTDLEIAIGSTGKPSAGTAKTVLEMLSKGDFLRRDGVLVKAPEKPLSRRVRFPDGEKAVLSVPWGDLVTAHRSTGASNITTYMAVPGAESPIMELVTGFLRWGTSSAAFQQGATKVIDRFVTGPSKEDRDTLRSYIWARAANREGQAKEAWLDTVEAYRLTAEAGIRAVEAFFARRPVGALTPAQAFGVDFVLEIESTRRLDRLG
ncbi:saccharopine dehydrogenase family protein [Chondromyces crocatus]|uniref:Saccharopine dehydrogenase n=1 Tax=Chondromyces crocatus TaxID=52 RepID=A0A0K1EPW7_CHOCO|nr:saccharopine dehydrogenase NADP-binding domain-containing protein [Chondromyces crocatus]AKT42896.1 saccharopine dehydrogenase [Chondromyces crocatus]